MYIHAWRSLVFSSFPRVSSSFSRLTKRSAIPSKSFCVIAPSLSKSIRWKYVFILRTQKSDMVAVERTRTQDSKDARDDNDRLTAESRDDCCSWRVGFSYCSRRLKCRFQSESIPGASPQSILSASELPRMSTSVRQKVCYAFFTFQKYMTFCFFEMVSKSRKKSLAKVESHSFKMSSHTWLSGCVMC